jgi:hypothetical protein
MLAYYALISLILLAGPLMGRTVWGKRLFAALMTAVFSLMAGLRFSVGWDYTSYVTYFGMSAFAPIEKLYGSRTEKGYAILNRILAETSIDSRFLMFFVGITVSLGFMLFFYRFASSLWMASFLFVALGFYYNTLCFLRQIIAAVILLWALRYAHERRFSRYLLLVFFASCFHLSAVFMIPLYFAVQIPITKKVMAIYAPLSALIFFNSQRIIALVTRILYKSYVPGSVHVIKGLNWVYFMFSLAIFAVCFLLRKELSEVRSENKTYLSFLFFATLLDLIAVKHSIVSRVGLLFMAGTTVVLLCDSYVILTEKLRCFANRRGFLAAADYSALLVGVGFVIFGLAFHHLLMINNYNGVVPYRLG